ncbi:MAG: hypothetical protein MUP80_04600, partial [Acidobacteriia bacterium]|nr:hypothetical protein [Terriglobia bacterium]
MKPTDPPEPAGGGPGPKQFTSEAGKLHMPELQDLFISFVYAAAANITIAHYLDNWQHPRPISGLLSILLMLMFLGSDWLSHARIRLQLPPDNRFEPGQSLGKFALDLGTVYLLTVAFVSLIDDMKGGIPQKGGSPALGAFTAFALFAIISWCWNLLVLDVMKPLNWSHLAKASCHGNLPEIPEVQSYASEFLRRAKQEEEKIMSELKAKDRDVTSDDLQKLGRAVDRLKRRMKLRQGALGWFGELVAVHVAFAHLVGGIALLVAELGHKGLPLLPAWAVLGARTALPSWLTIVLLVAVLFLLPSLLFSGGYRQAGAISFCVVFLLIYFSSP